jgi:hypothetical protein
MSAASRPGLRRFGLLVGGAFLVLAAVSRWRGHTLPPLVLGALGGALVVPAVLAPRLLAPVERGWMRGAAVLGEVNSRILLTVLFYLVIAPIGFVLRRIRDPLDRSLRDPARSTWIRRPAGPVDPARYERQF